MSNTKKVSPKAAAEIYEKEARSWETDKVVQLESSRKVAWWIAGVSAFAALSAIVAVAALTPLKEVQPYAIRVNESTGSVEVISSLKNSETTYEEAIRKYFIQQYLTFRESYSYETRENYYEYVSVMSGGAEQQKYFNWMNPGNPVSPINQYTNMARVKVRIKGVSFINPTVALVRYVREIDRGPELAESSHWAATISFKFENTPMEERDRAINPLGFRVIDYRNDPDSAIDNKQGGAAQPRPAAQPQPTSPQMLLPGMPAAPAPSNP